MRASVSSVSSVSCFGERQTKNAVVYNVPRTRNVYKQKTVNNRHTQTVQATTRATVQATTRTSVQRRNVMIKQAAEGADGCYCDAEGWQGTYDTSKLINHWG